MIGKACTVQQGGNAREQWKAFLSDGSNDLLQSMPQRVSPAGDCAGYMGGYDAKTKTFTEMPGVFMRPGTAVPDGFDFMDLPSCRMGICRIFGKTPHLERGAHNKAVRLMRAQGYEPDYSFGFSLEYYAYQTFVRAKEENRGVYVFRYYLPCKKVR